MMETEALLAKSIDEANVKTRQSRVDDILLDRRIEQHFRTTRPSALPGRNVFFNRMRHLDNKKYKKNFSNTFPNSPGSEF